MREEAIYQFLEALGVDRINMSTDRGWVNCLCPLAPYTHAGGSDTRPSFGISINEEEKSVYWCFGCSPKGKPLGYLLHSLWVLDGRYPHEAARIYARTELFEERKDLDEIHTPDRWVKKTLPEVDPLPPSVLRRYSLLQGRHDFEARRVRNWLEVERGIPEHIQNLHRLRYHYSNQSVIFPMTDKFGNIFLLRERLRKEKRIWTVNPELAGFPNMEFPKLSQAGVWFGMELVDWSKTVLLVEGEIDRMKLAALGFFNAMASCTSSVTDAQISAITAKSIMLGFDADKAGNLARNRVIDRQKGKDTTLYDLDWSTAKKEDGTPCKDAGDLPDREALLEVLENAEQI